MRPVGLLNAKHSVTQNKFWSRTVFPEWYLLLYFVTTGTEVGC
jgi:hypothetical protein